MSNRACRCGGLRRNGVCGRCGRGKTEDRRPTAAARGYDRQWRNFRLLYLAEHPLCEDCLPERAIPAVDVHHQQKLAERPDLKYHSSNLRALCGACHRARTARGE